VLPVFEMIGKSTEVTSSAFSQNSTVKLIIGDILAKALPQSI
jgi:hypothetical protein